MATIQKMLLEYSGEVPYIPGHVGLEEGLRREKANHYSMDLIRFDRENLVKAD